MNKTQSLKGAYKGKSLLFIGPGESKSLVNIQKLTKQVDYVASLNDEILFRHTDFYFCGERFICNYVFKHCHSRFLKSTIKIFLGVNEQYLDSQKLNIAYCANPKKFKSTKYKLPLLSRKFTKTNLHTISGLLYNFPQDASYYVKSRTLSNALQILYGLGFERVYLIGFMDSHTYRRLDYTHQKIYVKKSGERSPQKTKKGNLRRSFTYQSQILRTVSHIYRQNGRILCDLNPKRDFENGLLTGSV